MPGCHLPMRLRTVIIGRPNALLQQAVGLSQRFTGRESKGSHPSMPLIPGFFDRQTHPR
jgi:hypothetical protein